MIATKRMREDNSIVSKGSKVETQDHEKSHRSFIIQIKVKTYVLTSIRDCSRL